MGQLGHLEAFTGILKDILTVRRHRVL